MASWWAVVTGFKVTVKTDNCRDWWTCAPLKIVELTVILCVWDAGCRDRCAQLASIEAHKALRNQIFTVKPFQAAIRTKRICGRVLVETKKRSRLRVFFHCRFDQSWSFFNETRRGTLSVWDKPFTARASCIATAVVLCSNLLSSYKSRSHGKESFMAAFSARTQPRNIILQLSHPASRFFQWNNDSNHTHNMA